MNHGPLIFLAAFLGMAGSWFGYVLVPKTQLGALQPTNSLANVTYPVDRPGLARLGLEVYRANGCAYCHSQQAYQTGTLLEIVVADVGTNQPAVVAALQSGRPELSEAKAATLVQDLPAMVYQGTDRTLANRIQSALSAAGAKSGLSIRATGPDIARGWATRRTVAADFLFDATPMPGYQRIGPDLANVGARLPDPNWHLLHLYHPRTEVEKSTMPAYPFLFEERRLGRTPSPNALSLKEPYAPRPGYEIVPREEALALVAYLQSLRANEPLFSAPVATASLQATPSEAADATTKASP